MVEKKKDSVTVEAMGAEVAGRKWEVAPGALDDFEILDMISRWSDGNLAAVPAILRRILGDDQANEAIAHLREQGGGRVSIEAGSDFVSDLFKALNPNS